MEEKPINTNDYHTIKNIWKKVGYETNIDLIPRPEKPYALITCTRKMTTIVFDTGSKTYSARNNKHSSLSVSIDATTLQAILRTALVLKWNLGVNNAKES